MKKRRLSLVVFNVAATVFVGKGGGEAATTTPRLLYFRTAIVQKWRPNFLSRHEERHF